MTEELTPRVLKLQAEARSLTRALEVNRREVAGELLDIWLASRGGG